MFTTLAEAAWLHSENTGMRTATGYLPTRRRRRLPDLLTVITLTVTAAVAGTVLLPYF